MAEARGARNRLMKEYKDLQKEKWLNIEFDESAFFKWTIGLIVVNSDSVWNGAYFKTEMSFSTEYPITPPTFKFLNPIYHPNIYTDGKVCISILHPPGDDEQSGEKACERWSSIQGVDSILRSILVLLDDPEIGSPANVDAGVMYRDHREAYNAKAKEAVAASQKDIPDGFIMPTTLTEAPPAKIADDVDFWAESGDDFGASDTEEDSDMDDDDEYADQEFNDEEGEEGEEQGDEMKD